MIDHSALVPLKILHRATLADVGTPVIEAGESGMKGYRGVLVPSVSNPGEISVLWLFEFNDRELGRGRMQTGITYGTVPDIGTRLGYLRVLDYAEDSLKALGCLTLAEMRASHNWGSNQQDFQDLLLRVLREPGTDR